MLSLAITVSKKGILTRRYQVRNSRILQSQLSMNFLRKESSIFMIYLEHVSIRISY